MASLSEVERVLLTEKLKNLKPLVADSYSSYGIKFEDFQFSLTATTVKEAAIKFAFGLLALKKLNSKDKPLAYTCEDLFSRLEIEYKAFKVVVESKEKPIVILRRYVNSVAMNSDEEGLQLDDYQMQQEPFAPMTVGDGTLDDLLMSTLREYFGYTEFRPLQKEITKNSLSGNNVLGILGTGSGKSLTFLLPAVLATSPTLVIMPTKSLIDDILVRCKDLNISSCKFTGNVPKDVQKTQLENFSSFKLIFSTPEMIEDDLLAKIEGERLARVVFDEAHIVTTWGSTFRPIYKLVAAQMSKLQCPKLLLSATVPDRQQKELTELFGNLVIIRDSVFRDNLVLEVNDRASGTKFYDELASYVEQHKGCGIIYCVLSSDVARIHSELIKRDINCAKYHGQLSENVKMANFSKWNSGEVEVMVANSAFGMGIDKSNVRFVVHAKLPTNVDDYFQQCGRAGRDGEPAVCCIFYSNTDKTALLKMFKHHSQFEQQSKLLNDLIIYLEDLVQCRHKSIMTYYGEDRDGFLCGNSCDNCKNNDKFVTTDGTADALKVVQAIVELTGKKVTFNLLKLFLAGSTQKCIQENDLDCLSTYGSLRTKFIPIVMLQRFLNLLIYYDVLMEVGTMNNNSISVTVVLGCNAHKLIDFSLYVPKYEKR